MRALREVEEGLVDPLIIVDGDVSELRPELLGVCELIVPKVTVCRLIVSGLIGGGVGRACKAKVVGVRRRGGESA